MKHIILVLILLLLFSLPASTGASAPVADFSANVTSGSSPLPVSFTDLSLNSPTGWAWYFGDEDFSQPWTMVNDTSERWSVRDYHSSVALADGSLVLMGGRSSGVNQNNTWRSMDNGSTWTQINSSAGWTARYAHSSVTLSDGSIVLMGGSDGSNNNDTWRSTDNGATWTLMNSSSGWSARYRHSSVALPDGSIVLMGGYDDVGRKNDTWCSTDNGVTWTEMNSSAGWTARNGHSSVALPSSSIVLMGGIDGSYKNDVWRSNDNGATWTQINSSAGWVGRTGFSSFVLPDGSILLMGGRSSGGRLNDVWRSIDDGATWTQVNSGADWSIRGDQSSVLLPDGSIVLMGGYDGSTYMDDVWRLTTAGSSEQNPTHTYTSAGTYQVTLQAYNSEGYNSTIQADYITVTGSIVPVANFTANVTSGNSPLSVNFTDLSANAPTSWLWSFGDGNTSTQQNPTYTYTTAGNYTVNLTATNTAGSNTSTQVDYITVTEAPFEATTVNASYTSVTYNENDNMTVDSGISVTGSSTFTSARIYIGDGYVEGEDFLRFTNTSSINGSFNPLTGILSLSGSGSAAAYQEAFRNVRYENINDNPNTSDRNITFVMGGNTVYLESTGHYYESVYSESAIFWTDAKAAAEARSLSGMQGYLATILTEEESVFLESKAPDNAWIGANDVAVEGEWRWVTGPQNITGEGTLFFYQENHTTLPGFYTNWNSGEPNNAGDNEHYGQILGADNKKWNDLPSNHNVYFYLVEYGGMPDEPTPQLTATITVNINSINDAPSMPGNFTSPLAGDPVERGSTITVSWGESTDPENDAIAYDLWYFNGTWSQIADPLDVTNYEFTIPIDDVSEAMFKVYANDSVANSSENNVTFTLMSITPGSSFTADVTSGLAPLTVNFTYSSSHYPTNWIWDFGDGNTSNEQNPTYTYYTPGTYDVSLNISNLGGYNISTETAYITAAYVPVANFSSNVTSGAVPLAVNFTDTSLNDPTGWEWDFGDGNISTVQNPTHVYASEGTYTVSLNATNVGGSNISTQTIITDVVPVASFTVNVTSGALPLSVNFTDQSANATAWYWEFGDGNTSTSQNPTHIYEAVGTYTVNLTAINTISGNDTLTRTDYIRVAIAPVAAFSSNVTSGAVPLSVNFTDESANTPTDWFWDFGDGTNSTEQNPTHIYSSAGTYTVSLNATNVGGSNATTQTDRISAAEIPVANFTANVTSGAVPLSVSFTDMSTNSPTYWYWDFGDGTNSTEQNATHTYSSVGTYTVSLNVTNVGGSNISTQTIITDVVPVANFTANITSGALPLSVNFTDQSANATAWYWEFGDGNASALQNPTHTYEAVGTYTVNLTAINTISGNDTLTRTDYITVAIAPVANFTASATSGTAPFAVTFTDNSTNTPTSWVWDFGDGTNSTEQNPTHIYTSAGTYNVSLNASNVGGYNVSTLTGYITVNSVSSSSSGRRVSVSPGQPEETVTSTYTSVKHVLGGSSVEYDLSDTGSPILGISFDAKDNEGIVVAKVQVLSDGPEGVSAPPGNPYQLMSIDVGSQGTISSHNADNILIHFKVSREWIRENNIDPSTIRMARYNEGKWEELPTQSENEDDEYLYFVAETPGFSIFSVVGDEVKTVSQEVQPVSQDATFEAPEEGKGISGFTAAMGLVFVSLAFIVSRRFRQ